MKDSPRIASRCRLMARSVVRGALVLCVSSVFAIQPAFAQAIGAVSDPWEGYNRPVFDVNEGVDALVFKPAAQTYDKTPDVIRGRIVSFLNNLDDVPVMMNNVLQGDIGDAGNDLGRLVVNSTMGLGGLFDVAQHLGMQKNREDFGKTLGAWGVGQGNYLMLPLLGPSSARDFPALIADIFMHPATYFAPGFRAAITLLNALESRAGLLDKEEVIKAWSSDYYAGVRNYYMSRRSFGDDGGAPEETYEYDIDFEEEERQIDEETPEKVEPETIEENLDDDSMEEETLDDSSDEKTHDAPEGGSPEDEEHDGSQPDTQTAAPRAETIAGQSLRGR